MADINLTSPEAILMIPIAMMLDGAMLAIGLAGDWWGFSDYGVIGWLGWFIIGIWAYIRKGGIAEQIKNETKEENPTDQKEKQEHDNEKEIADADRDLARMQQKEGATGRGPQKAEDISDFAKRKNRQNKIMTDNPKNKQSITNVKAKTKKKLREGVEKLLKRYGFGFIVKGIPIVGDFWPGFTIFVIREIRR